MKRHDLLIREILKHLEDTEPSFDAPEILPFSRAEVVYHMALCCQAGFVFPHEGPASGIALSWQGRSLLV